MYYFYYNKIYNKCDRSRQHVAILTMYRGRRCGDSMVDLQLPVQSVPITTKVVSSNPVHGEVHSIQHYVIKFVSDMRQIGEFLRVFLFPPPIKLTTTI